MWVKGGRNWQVPGSALGPLHMALQGSHRHPASPWGWTGSDVAPRWVAELEFGWAPDSMYFLFHPSGTCSSALTPPLRYSRENTSSEISQQAQSTFQWCPDKFHLFRFFGRLNIANLALPLPQSSLRGSEDKHLGKCVQPLPNAHIPCHSTEATPSDFFGHLEKARFVSPISHEGGARAERSWNC